MPSIDYVPTDTTVPSPLKNLRVKLVDPAATLDERDKWARLFEAVFIKHSGN
jgi:iron(III) transport system substrate-binding protein